MSSHSIDLFNYQVSKVDLLNDCIKKVDGLSVLCIGDSGEHLGNDSEMLMHIHSLSVGSVSNLWDCCWNISSPSVHGVRATKSYLSSLDVVDSGKFVFNKKNLIKLNKRGFDYER